MAISFKGLLGSMAAPQNQYNSLLGTDPRAARWNAIGGFLEGAGVGLMTGDWSKGLEASNAADERFQRQQLLGYEMKKQADNQAYDRSRDAKADEWREKQFLEDQKRYGMDYALRKRQADLSAENNRILRDRQLRQWGQEDAITQGQIGAIDQWTDNFKSQGGDLFSPEMQGVLRSNGIAGVDPQDTVKFRQAQPFIGAGAVGPAFDVLAKPAAPTGDLPKGYRWRQDGTAEVIPGVTPAGSPRPYTPGSRQISDASVAKEENAILEQTLVTLDEAAGLANDANSGYFSVGRAKVAENVSDGLVPDSVFGSPKQGAATLRLKQIMDAEALASMGKLLKGPTSDRDVRIMLETVNDPNASPKRKQESIDQVRRLVKAQIAANKDQIDFLLKGPQSTDGGGNGAADNADPLGLR